MINVYLLARRSRRTTWWKLITWTGVDILFGDRSIHR